MMYNLGRSIRLINSLHGGLSIMFWSNRWELSRIQCDRLVKPLATSIKVSLGEHIQLAVRSSHAT